MTSKTSRAVSTVAIGLVMIASGCAGSPASSEQRRLGERQLLLPFLQNTDVACSELEVEITPNFHLHVSQPGINKGRQRFDSEQREALTEKTWRNLTGDRAGWFQVTICEPKDPTDVSGTVTPRTTYTVMSQFTLRVRERGEMTLSARAKGPIVLVQEAGAKPRDMREFAIVNGVVTR